MTLRMLVSGATRLLERHACDPHLGGLVTPRTRNAPDWYARHDFPYAADNDAYSYFDEARYEAMLARLETAEHRPLWVAAPDVVADARATERLYERWRDVLRLADLPVAFIAQNGAAPDDVPWSEIACVFIGGDDTFKLGPAARAIALRADVERVALHLGRVNSRRRIAYARELGAATFDGSAISKWPDSRAPRMIAELRQGNLFNGGPL
jgi:hypothetical protein